MTTTEQQLSPLMREAIRELRKQWYSVEVVEPVVDGAVRLLVAPDKTDEPRARLMWEDADGNVYHQSRVKINGHFGPTLRVGEDRSTPTPVPAPKRAHRRQYTKRLHEEAVLSNLTQNPSPWMRRAELNNKLTVANQAFSREPTRMNLMLVQAARTALNMVDEEIATDFEAQNEQ